MKIKLNALGFGEGKLIYLAENLMKGGLLAIGLGLATTISGFLLQVNSQEWNITSDQNTLDHYEEVYSCLHPDENSES